MIRPSRIFHECVPLADMLMHTLTIIHADGRFKVLENGERIWVPISTGQTLPVEFETREAAEGNVRVYRIMTRKKARSHKKTP